MGTNFSQLLGREEKHLAFEFGNFVGFNFVGVANL